MENKLLIELLNELIGYNSRAMSGYQADGNREMESYARGKVDAYETILDAIN